MLLFGSDFFLFFFTVGREYCLTVMRSFHEPWLEINGVCYPLVVTTFTACTDSGFVFSELLQSLDMCDNDPVAIAQCFVDKVSGKFSCCLTITSYQ